MQFLLYLNSFKFFKVKVAFGNLDLNSDSGFKLIYLKSRDSKSIDFRSYFKSKHLMWRLVRGNVLEFLGMFKDSMFSCKSR